MYKPSDVEIINQLCAIDTCLREAKKAVDNLHGNVPKIIHPAMKTLLDNVKILLKRKNELRVMLWKEYGIFYISDV